MEKLENKCKIESKPFDITKVARFGEIPHKLYGYLRKVRELKDKSEHSEVYVG